MSSKLKFLLVTCFSVLVFLLLAEGISRLVLHRHYNRSFDSSLIVDNKYFTSSGLKQNAAGMVWGKRFHTDEFGGRRNVAQNKGKRKWLFIGDSVTEGVGVEDSATFASLCSQQFPEYHVLNLSLIGYSTYDYLNVLRSVLARDTSVELVTLFYCLNDVYGKAKVKDLPVMAKHNFLGSLNSFLQERYATYKLVKLFFYRNSDSYYKYDSIFYALDNSNFRESMSYLEQCDSLCKASNIFFQVVMLPYKSQLHQKTQYQSPEQLVGDFCSANSIEFSNAAYYLRKQNDPSSLYLFSDEIHLSAKGHHAMADFLTQ